MAGPAAGDARLRARVRRLLPESRFLRRLGVLTGGSALAQALVVAATPLLTRLYGPDAFGLFVVVTNLAGILGSAACLRYDAAVPLARSTAAAVPIVQAALAATLLTGLLAALALAAAAPALAGLLEPADGRILWWLVPALLATGASLAADGWVTRKGDLRLMVAGRLIHAVALTALQLALFPFGAEGLIAGWVLAYVAYLAPPIRRATPGERRALRRWRRRRLAAALRRHRRFPLLATPAILLNAAARLLPGLLLAGLHGPEVAGFFGLAQRLAGLPLRFVGSSASQLYTAELAGLGRGEGERLRLLFRQVSRQALLLGAAYLLPLAAAGLVLIEPVFGPGWAPAGPLLLALVPMYLAGFVSFPTRNTLVLLGRQDLTLLLDGLATAATLGAFVAGRALGLGVLPTVLLYAAGAAATGILQILVTRRLITRRIAQARVQFRSAGGE